MSGWIFGDVHRAYMRRAETAEINVAEGSVRAGKTVDNVFVFASLLEHAPDRLHLATGSTLGNAKLNLGDCNGLGLEHIFAGRCRWTKYRGNEALVIRAEAGERIVIFSGGKNADAYKRIRGNSYGMWLATEINLHADSFIKEAFNRQLAARDRRVFWDLNPSAPSHPIYRDYLDRFETLGERYNYAHFTIRDNPVVTPERLRAVMAQYDEQSVWYRRDILGERCAADGLVYRRFADDPEAFKVPSIDPGQADYLTVGVDFGGNRSRTTFVATAVMKKSADPGGFTVVADHAVAGSKGEVDAERINREFTRFLAAVRERMPGVPVRYVFADNEAQVLVNSLRRHLASLPGERVIVADAAKRKIVDRIAFVNTLMSQGRLRLYADCELLAAGLASAVWDEKSPVDKRLDDFTSDIDILDAFEYSIERYMR
ncbi:MAG: PBSX family phage terminase large subunit [Clostridia bacterium]|nr:PBSX family phage terminase large subunit [Clostridia bacterium]